MRYVGTAWPAARRATRAIATITFEDTDDEAMLVTDRSGRFRNATEKGRRLLLLATTSDINPQSLRSSVNERASAWRRMLCRKLDAVARGEDASPPAMTFETKWGRHVMRAYWLNDDYESADALIGVRIQRQEPMILRFVRAMGAPAAIAAAARDRVEDRAGQEQPGDRRRASASPATRWRTTSSSSS
jgi:hypothetical protein